MTPAAADPPVKVLDSPFIQRFDKFFSNNARTEQFQAFLNDRGHNLTLSETKAFLQMAREHIIAVYDHETFDEMQAYIDDHPNQLADSARATFQGNDKLISNHQDIYGLFLDLWEEGDPDRLLGAE